MMKHEFATKQELKDRSVKRLALTIATALTLVAIAACGGDEAASEATAALLAEPTVSSTDEATLTPGPSGAGDPETRVLAVSGTEYSFDAPEMVPEGSLVLRFTNAGQDAHELRLLRFNQGVLIHQFMGSLHGGGGLDAALQMTSEAGSVGAVGPGESAEAAVSLAPGNYVLVSLVEGQAGGLPDLLNGMAWPFTVTAVQ